MRILLFLPLLFLAFVRPCQGGWAGAPSPGGVSAGAPAGGNRGTVNAAPVGGRPSAPVNFAGNPRGMVTAPVVGNNYRPPVGVTNPAGGNRYVPITAGARPVGTVLPPRPIINNNGLPVRSYPRTNGITAPTAIRPYSPPAPPTVAAPTRLTNFAAAAAAARNRAGENGTFRPRPNQPQRNPTYSYYPQIRSYASPYPGHYVPGETYVQQPSAYPSVYPFNVAPPYYLGGAFPFFYGSGIGASSTYFDAGVPTVIPPTDSAPPSAPATPSATTPGQEAPTPPADASGGASNANGAKNPPSGNGSSLAGPNSMVEAVQAELLRRGYFGGTVDGVFGSVTSDALRRFQGNQGLARTGLINEATLFALGLN